MKNFEKAQKAVSKLGRPILIMTDDTGRVYAFKSQDYRKIPGQHTTPPTAYVRLFRKPLSRLSITEIVSEISSQLHL